MALQDVCGFQEIPLYPRCSAASFIFSDSTAPWTCAVDEKKPTLRTPWERGGENPLYLLLPPPGQRCSRRRSSRAPPAPFALSHGTTTLAFTFQGGAIAAADTRASCAGLVCSPDAQKVTPIHSHLVVTSSGSGADCVVWERVLAREIRLYQLRHGRRLTVRGAGKLLALMLHPFKGTEVCVAATLCGWDGGDEAIEGKMMDHAQRRAHDTVSSITQSPLLLDEPENINARSTLTSGSSTLNSGTLVTSDQTNRTSVNGNLSQGQILSTAQCAAGPQPGPRVCYVCSDGLRLNGELISVGSGSPYAYSVLDVGWRWKMSSEEATALAREAVYRATHRDAYSGNNVDLFHITACGWRRRRREDLKEEYYREKRRGKERIRDKTEMEGKNVNLLNRTVNEDRNE
ncbi:proteasome subunit beta type-11a [Brachyhypopomus gauderio]|uniref:proteasome subunit beta type-11a n=1 Tax=Brachyhypopomus gauderio TaxID=698409 RepID=UPI004042AC3D